MFCKKCGKEVQDNWQVCPNCGQKLQNEKSDIMPKQINEQSNSGISGPADVKQNFEQTKNGFNARFILKVLAIIMVICFFCPLYMVSCAGQEVLEVSGADLTFGIQYMDEEIEGNLMYTVLLLLPLFCLMTAFISKRFEINGEYEDEMSCFYYSSAGSLAMILFLKYVTGMLKDRSEETALSLEINVCTAYYIIIATSLLYSFIGAYQVYLLKLRTTENVAAKEKTAIKVCGLILAEGLGIFLIIAVIMTYISGSSELDSLKNQYLSKKSETRCFLEEDADYVQIEGFNQNVSECMNLVLRETAAVSLND